MPDTQTETRNFPAFPCKLENNTNTPKAGFYDGDEVPAGTTTAYAGMSLRDYFIAHAPVEPQTWFSPVMPPEPVKPSVIEQFTDSEYQEFNGWDSHSLSTSELKEPRVKAYAEAYDAFNEALANIVQETRKQTYIQWPAAWADAMLAARAK